MVELDFFFFSPWPNPGACKTFLTRDPTTPSEVQVQSLNLWTTREAHAEYLMQHFPSYCHTKTTREMFFFPHCAYKNIQHEKINLLKELHSFFYHKYLDSMPGLLSISL